MATRGTCPSCKHRGARSSAAITLIMAPIVITLSDSELEESPTKVRGALLKDWRARKQYSDQNQKPNKATKPHGTVSPRAPYGKAINGGPRWQSLEANGISGRPRSSADPKRSSPNLATARSETDRFERISKFEQFNGDRTASRAAASGISQARVLSERALNGLNKPVKYTATTRTASVAPKGASAATTTKSTVVRVSVPSSQEAIALPQALSTNSGLPGLESEGTALPSRKRRRLYRDTLSEDTQSRETFAGAGIGGHNSKAPFTGNASRTSQSSNEGHARTSAVQGDVPQDSRTLAPDSTPDVSSNARSASLSQGHGNMYTAADDALLYKLKKTDNLSWEEIMPYFPGRSRGSLQVHWSTKAKNSSSTHAHLSKTRNVKRKQQDKVRTEEQSPPLADVPQVTARRRVKRGGGVSVLADFIRWSEVDERVLDEPASEAIDSTAASQTQGLELRQEPSYPEQSSLSQILRHRELGGVRSTAASRVRVGEQMKNHAFKDLHMQRYFTSTCGDVTCLAWSPSGARFAAGSIALTDDRSMQYNSNLNLLLGDCKDGALLELPEHHVARPEVDRSSGNINGLQAMRGSQDQRLFMTVTSVSFSPDGQMLYSAGSDKKVRAYKVCQDLDATVCHFEIDCEAPADLLSVSNFGLLATACRSSGDGSVSVYQCGRRGPHRMLSLSPSRTDSASKLPLYPSAMKFGRAKQHSNLLLAGFSSDALDQERDEAGETSLWDVVAGQRISISTQTRNVFDVAWNPSPSPASMAFAVACTPESESKKKRNTRSVIQCFAPNQGRARRILLWDCPAFDINDLVICPYDDNLIAAGATDGKVYIWDKRFADRNQAPLQILSHGPSLNVLDHDRDVEIADTGIRFLSWGATGSRLYSASSDGVVKVWDPYRSGADAHVKDAAVFKSSIMSGAFSPDYRELLVGEECGRLNLLSVQSPEHEGRTAPRFKLHSAPEPSKAKEPGLLAAKDLLRSKQIELRPMGDLPIRQAVQGRNYDGPYFVPSREEWTDAEQVYRRAVEAQNEAHDHALQQASQSSELGTAARDADNRVLAAQMALQSLQSRYDAYAELNSKAEAKQRAFRKAEKERLKLEASLQRPTEYCKLDCNYLPKDVYSAGSVPDSRQSEQRIPAAYRSAPRGESDLNELNCQQLYDAGLASQCPHCGAAETSAMMKLHLKYPERVANPCLQRQASIRAEFFDKDSGRKSNCKNCSAPVRWSEDTQGSLALCVRCNFACHRCARRAHFSDDGTKVTCEDCGLIWTAGILGYDLMDSLVVDQQANKLSKHARQQPFDKEIDHYHSLWRTESLD